MKSICLIPLAALAGLIAASPAGATNTVISGSYDGNSDVYESGSLSLFPGTYVFNLSFTQPVDSVDGGLSEVYTFNDYCDFGEGVVYCGGDDEPILPLFEEVSPTLYQLTIPVFAGGTTYYPPGSVYVREDYSYSCCTYSFDIYSGAAGQFTLSYAAIPEPATWSMLLLGFAAIGFSARRRRTKALAAV